MLETLKSGLRTWTRGANDRALLLADPRAGDRLGDGGDLQAWRGMRHQLAERALALAVVAVGETLFLAPWDAQAQMPCLRQMAAEAASGCEASRAATRDLTADLFGEVPGLADAIIRAGKAGPKCREVPGGELTVRPGQKGVTPPAALNPNVIRRQVTQARAVRARVTKLSRLQRSLLSFARDFATKRGTWRGEWVPLSLRPVRSRAESAARSRALRRLEKRGLIRLRDARGQYIQNLGGWQRGRATHFQLTRSGWDLVEPAAEPTTGSG